MEITKEQPAHLCKASHPFIRFAFYVETMPSKWYELCWDETGKRFLSIPSTYCQWCGVELNKIPTGEVHGTQESATKL